MVQENVKCDFTFNNNFTMIRQNLQERDIMENLSVIWRILKWTLNHPHTFT
jgi:hypothetical protein